MLNINNILKIIFWEPGLEHFFQLCGSGKQKEIDSQKFGLHTHSIAIAVFVQTWEELHKLTNRTSAGDTSSFESMTAGGWLLGGSLATGRLIPLRDATWDLFETGISSIILST